jgi:uncharacterized protein YqjF (DUF2071 family)
MAIPFLTANWTNLCLLTYAVSHELLQPRLPPGLELEMREGRGLVSLVAFQFTQTRVLGIPWPGYRHFAEVNLRFYVRSISRSSTAPAERGVVFIREFVPQRLVAWMARVLYNEPYRTAPVTHAVNGTCDRITAEYQLTWAGATHRVRVSGRLPAFLPDESSDEHFFKEHHWGFGVDRRGRTIRYQVDHPAWQVYPIEAYHLDFDWAAVYGREWEFLAKQTPFSVVLAVGSAIAVHPKGRIQFACESQ